MNRKLLSATVGVLILAGAGPVRYLLDPLSR